MKSSYHRTTFIVLIVILCAVYETYGFRLLTQGDSYIRRQARLRQNPHGTGLNTQREVKPYPAHNDFLKQLISYLEQVGKRR